MLTLNRPAVITSDPVRLDDEYRAARWAHHRLLDFEDEHQRVLDQAAEAAAPGITRVGRILAQLARRARRAARTSEGTWYPDPRPVLAAKLKTRLAALRAQRNKDPRWVAALGWADEEVGAPKAIRRRRAKDPARIKRRKTETDEQFQKRLALLTRDETDKHYKEKLATAPRRTRREEYRAKIYSERRCYWGTWNAIVRSVDQARRDVLTRRKQGMPAEWRRPRFRDPISLAADAGGFRVVRGQLYWSVGMRIGTAEERVWLYAKCSNWHPLDENSEIKTAKLTRRRDGERWTYSLSLVVAGIEKGGQWATAGLVAFDWGHREHGHETEREGLRAFVWRGDDGRTGEVLVPRECRVALDEIDALKERMDRAFGARKAKLGLPDRNRYGYRRRLMRSGVRTEEESNWLKWEIRHERRVAKRRKRIANLRRETYLGIVRELRQSYQLFAFEDERSESIRRQQKEDETRRRIRANRDLVTRYEFVSICERFGAEIVPVPSRNTTRECPDCGYLAENGPELLIACPQCGLTRDKDHGATRVILRRAEQALANNAAE